MRRAQRRSPGWLIAGAVGALAAGCGDPLVILGDWPGYMRVVLGVPGSSGFRLDSIATNNLLAAPRGLAAAADGSLYVSDASGRIFRVSSDGRASLVLNAASCGGECPGQPQGLAIDSTGALLVADAGQRIWRVAGSIARPIAGNGQDASGPDGPALTTAILAPTGVAVDASGHIYFSEKAGYRVRRIESDGSLRTVAGTGASGFSGDGGPATLATLNGPAGLAVVGTTLYIADSGNQRVRAVDLALGTIRTVSGNGAPGFSGDGGPATAAQLSFPAGLAATPDTRLLFIVDQLNNRVRQVDLAAGTIRTFAGNGSTAFNGSGRGAAETALNLPTDVAASRYQQLFVLDAGHYVVWRTPLGL